MLTYLIILLPILWQISSPIGVISFGEFILMPVMVWKTIVKKKLKIRVPKGLLVFYFVPVLLTFISSFWGKYFEWSSSSTVIVRILYYFILICLAYDEFDFNIGAKFYFLLCCFAASYLFAQVIAYYADVLLPIPANYSKFLFLVNESIDTRRYYHIFGFRPASIFTEPSYFANYIAPMIAILLFYVYDGTFIGCIGRKKRLSIAALLTLAVLLSTSSLGVVYCAAIWLIFFFSDSSGINVKLQTKLLVIIIALGFVIFVFNSGVFALLIRRSMSGSSIGPRLIRGFIIYDRMPLSKQFIGLGLNNIGNFVRSSSIITIYDESNLNYSVTLTNRLMTTGVIGLGALVMFWVMQLIRRRKLVQRVLLVIMLISFIFESGEYTSGFAFLFILVLSSGGKSEEQSNESLSNKLLKTI